MEAVYNLEGGLRVVDLTKELDPKTETRRCHLYRFNTGGPIPDYHTIMDLTSHLGTHCECPYHHDDNWPSVAEIPLTSFFGRGIYVNIVAEERSYITGDLLDRYCLPLMRKGTVVILDSPHKLAPFTEDTNTEKDKRLRVNEESAIWLRDHGAKCIGFGDGVSIESSNEDVKPFHDILLKENILFLEVLKNLDKLEKSVFFISYAPLPIKGLDSCPVRAYAIENLRGFDE